MLCPVQRKESCLKKCNPSFKIGGPHIGYNLNINLNVNFKENCQNNVNNIFCLKIDF